MTGGEPALAPEALEASFQGAFTAMAPPPQIRIGCRVIRAGDEDHLLPSERLALTTRNLQARCASGAARKVARLLLTELGHPEKPIGRERSGQPVWPEGVVGSIAHDDEVAVAAVGSSAVIASIGIDVEPAEPLPSELLALVVTKEDVAGTANGELVGRLIFVAKEACYKAAHRLDGVILDYDDIVVDLTKSSARTVTGIVAQIYWCTDPRIIVLAIVGIDRA